MCKSAQTISFTIPDTLKECQDLLRVVIDELCRVRNELCRAKEETCRTKKEIKLLLKKLYGASSEKCHPPTDESSENAAPSTTETQTVDTADAQPTGEAPETANSDATSETAANGDAPKSKAPGRRKGGRKPLPKNLPRREIVCDVSEEEKICPDCGSEKKCIGNDKTEKLEFIPSSFYVLVFVRPKYACGQCQANISQAEMPAQPIEKGIPMSGVIAHVAVSKYCDHLPLYRQVQIFARHGVNISRSTLCGWLMMASNLLEPIARGMLARVLQSYSIHTDDTRIPVLAKKRTHLAYIWPYIGDEDNPYIYFDFTWTRARAGPAEILKDYKGFIHADAYPGYDFIYEDGEIIEVACWAHARRKFHDAKDSDPQRANYVLGLIGEMYLVEREAKLLDDAGRLSLRNERTRPLLDELLLWFETNESQVLPKGPISKAINYARKNWIALNRFVSDGKLAIDNNIAERTIRPICLGRKNWLFVGNQNGGKAAAIFYTLIESAKRHGIDPFVYIRDLLDRISVHHQSRLEELFPDQWKILFSDNRSGSDQASSKDETESSPQILI